MINVITFLVIKEGYITKSKLFFLSLLIVLLIPVQSRAEVTVIEEPTPPSITNIKFTPEGDQQVFKTGDSFEISFKVGNMVYETDTTYIKIFDGYPDCTYGVSCDMKDGTFQVTFAGEDFIVAEITEAEINKETGEYRIVVTLKKESTFVYGISSIKVQNGEVSTEKTFTQQAYWFRINNNCATNNHTIKSDTPFETITEPTCTEKGSQGKRCIYCNQIIDETIEGIPTIGHTPSENYETITHATCVSKGSQGKRCTVCEKIIEDTIQETPIDSHWHVGGWTKAETEEYYYAKCNSCGADIYHNWTAIEGIFMDDKKLNIGQENGAFFENEIIHHEN